MRKIVLIFVLIANVSFAQDNKVTLVECHESMMKNYPLADQSVIYQNISDLKDMSLITGWLPNPELKAQATYQSDVLAFDLDINFPIDIEIPEIQKDQYKATVDINQMIYDWGRIKAARKLENANLNVNQQNVQVELNKLKDQVNKFYFAVMILQKNNDLMNVFLEELQNKEKSVESAVKNGVLLKSDLSALKAEIIKVKQSIREIQNQQDANIEVLAEITGLELDSNIQFEIPQYNIEESNEIVRPELTLFDLQKDKLGASSKLINKQNRPTVFGFAQLGYGNPGLNMMNDAFDSYYYVGLGVSWKFWDWNKTKREKQIISLNQDLLNTQKNTFTTQIDMGLKSEKAKIKSYEEAIQSDIEIIELREEVSESARSKLDNGVITSTDYITEVSKETQAKLSFETHKIQLIQAKVNYLYMKGDI